MSNCWNCGASINNCSPRCPYCHKNFIMKKSDKENCLLIDYDIENKNLLLRWGHTRSNKFHTSAAFKNYILDLNEYGDVIGIELLDFDSSKEYNMEIVD